MQKSLEDVLAEAAIKDVQMRYCRAVDRMDFDLLESCFHPDATADYGFFKGGIDGFVAMAKESLKAFLSTTHFTGNQVVDVAGDKAWAEHYTLATHRCPKDEHGPLRDFATSVRYADRFARRNGDWRIAERLLILDWVRIDPVEDYGPGPQVEAGKRDKTDGSYRLR